MGTAPAFPDVPPQPTSTEIGEVRAAPVKVVVATSRPLPPVGLSPLLYPLPPPPAPLSVNEPDAVPGGAVVVYHRSQVAVLGVTVVVVSRCQVAGTFTRVVAPAGAAVPIDTAAEIGRATVTRSN